MKLLLPVLLALGHVAAGAQIEDFQLSDQDAKARAYRFPKG